MTGTSTTFALLDLLALALFILGLHYLNAPPTSRFGNRIAMVGMLIALVVVLVSTLGVDWWAIAIGVAIGAAVGIVAAFKVKMTAMPQMVALYNGAGGAAAASVSTVEFAVSHAHARALDPVVAVSLSLSAVIGAISASGSVIAFAKLQELMSGRPMTYRGQQVVNAIVALAIAAMLAVFIARLGIVPEWTYPGLIVAALVFGVLFVLPIGGADMPVVISLLNSATGVAVAITGFELSSTLLITGGALVGASGTILTVAMSRAMNRPLTNVLFGAFGAAGGAEPTSAGAQQNVRSVSVDDVAAMLAYASKVMFVPGYGMAVAQAQHSVKALADQLEKRGVKVLYAIHPVAGRMPGHMNVLLAEANVPYEQLLDLDDANAEFPTTDVALVIGANDVTNPAARNVTSSPIYGMPILDVDKAANVVVLKRSMRSGFAGIANPLYELPNCSMLFGDAKASVDALTAAVKEL
jgi:H+-translocating NAD(P) transhydrogenase subunit beta